MKSSFKIAFCGIMTALALVFMFMAPILPLALYTCTSLAGFCVMIACFEFGSGCGGGVWAAVSFLSFLLIPDKETVIIFILMFGLFPVFKFWIEKSGFKILKKKIVLTGVKLIFINISWAVYFLLSVNLLGIPKESFSIGNVYLPWLFQLMGSALLFLYDFSLDSVCAFYKIKLRRKLFGNKF